MIYSCFSLDITILITNIGIVAACTIALEQVHTKEQDNKLSSYIIKELLNVWKLGAFRIVSML